MSNFNTKIPSIIGAVLVTALIIVGCFLTGSLVPLVGLPIVGAGAYILTKKGSNERAGKPLNLKAIRWGFTGLAAIFTIGLFKVLSIDGFMTNEIAVLSLFITALIFVNIKMHKSK